MHITDWVGVEDEVEALTTTCYLRDKSFNWFVTKSIDLAFVRAYDAINMRPELFFGIIV
jgi:hypothetical protein